MNFEILLLDIDETLLDFKKNEDMGLKKTFQSHGYELTQEMKNTYLKINHGLWDAYEKGTVTKEEVIFGRFEKSLAALGIPGDAVEFETEYQAYLGEGCYLLPDAMETVKYLHKKYDLYVVTNGIAVTQRQRLEGSGLMPYMKDLFISEELGVQKPSKEFFEKCEERIPDFSREASLIIGDSLSSDIRGGLNAGIRTCWINRTGAENKSGIQPDYMVHGIAEVREFL